MKLPNDADCVSLAINHMPSMDKVLSDGTRLLKKGACGTEITWYCDSERISEDGIVSAGKEDENVTIYAVVTKGKHYSVKGYFNRLVTSSE